MKEGRGLEEVELFGLSYLNAEREATVSLLAQRAKERRFTAVFTPNAVMAAEAERSEEKKALLRQADLLIADGIGVTLASRLSLSSPISRIAGIDAAEALLPTLEREGLSLFLYGGREGVAERAKAALLLRYPRLCIETHDGYSSGAFEKIMAFSPSVLFVCLGFPRQETFILSLKDKLPCVAMGLGGSLDVWSGNLVRAPLLFRKMGLEWLWRIAREPRRLGRLFPLPRFFLRAAWQGARKSIQKKQKKGLQP